MAASSSATARRRRAGSSTQACLPKRDRRKTSSFAPFLRQTQIFVLEILKVFLRVKSSPFLTCSKTETLQKPPSHGPAHDLLKSPNLHAHSTGSGFRILVQGCARLRASVAKTLFLTDLGRFFIRNEHQSKAQSPDSLSISV